MPDLFHASRKQLMVMWTVLMLLFALGFSFLMNINLLRVEAKGGGAAQQEKRLNTTGTPGDWMTYQGDLGRSGYNNSETKLTLQTTAQLHLQWSYQAGGGISSQPVVANGLIYWGSWDGYEHASDLLGNPVWATMLGQAQNTKCPPADAGVAGTASVGTISINGQVKSVVYVGSGTAHFYALDALTGAILWNTSLGSSPNHMIWAGSAVYKGSVYVGVSSYGDCPLVRGRLVKLDALTGAVQNSYYTVPPNCVGGGIWSAPTIDAATNIIYVATGTQHICSQPEKLAIGVIALDATTLALISSWQLPPADRVNDTDFGSTPTLFQATIGGNLRSMLGLVNKNGYYYALDRTQLSAGPLWNTHLSLWIDHAHVGKYSIASTAWDGTTLYAGGAQTAINGVTCAGSLRALDPSTGAFLWQTCLAAPVIDAVMVVPGLVVAGTGNSLVVVGTATGQVLFTYQDTNANSIFWGSATIANGVLYEGNNDGMLYAFSPQPPPPVHG